MWNKDVQKIIKGFKKYRYTEFAISEQISSVQHLNIVFTTLLECELVTINPIHSFYTARIDVSIDT